MRDASTMNHWPMKRRTVIDDVRDKYAEVAKSGLSNDSVAVRSVVAAFGYSQDDLASLPEQANMGLSCGNPLALASVSLGGLRVRCCHRYWFRS